MDLRYEYFSRMESIILERSSEKLIVAIKLKETQTPILSSACDFESDTLLSNTYTVIIRGKFNCDSPRANRSLE